MIVREGVHPAPASQDDSVAKYFREEVFPEPTAAKETANIVAAKKRELHNFVQDSARHSRRESRERQKKLETEPKITKWDCGCVTIISPEGLYQRSQCGTDDCLYERGMARIVR